MISIRNLVTAAATFTLAAALPVQAASRIVPALPTSFEPVNLRMTVDSCTFTPLSVHVRATLNTLRVTQLLNACLLPGSPEIVDVRLGSFPEGDYRVEVYGSSDSNAPLLETLSFHVSDLPVPSPPNPRPLAGYTGLWWSPQESGWGLALHQSAADGMFGGWFVYGSSGQPEWFTLQGGQWIDSTTWRGTLYRTTGPSFAGPTYDPRLVLVQAAGSATLDFRLRAGEEGRARFTYTVNGATVTKVIERMSF